MCKGPEAGASLARSLNSEVVIGAEGVTKRVGGLKPERKRVKVSLVRI